MATMQDALDLARIDLNDADALEANRRWPDAELLKHANGFVQLARFVRPDLFLGGYASPPTELAAGQGFPLDAMYLRGCADYIAARAHGKDTEEAIETKAAVLLKLALAQLSGV